MTDSLARPLIYFPWDSVCTTTSLWLFSVPSLTGCLLVLWLEREKLSMNILLTSHIGKKISRLLPAYWSFTDSMMMLYKAQSWEEKEVSVGQTISLKTSQYYSDYNIMVNSWYSVKGLHCTFQMMKIHKSHWNLRRFVPSGIKTSSMKWSWTLHIALN